VITTNYDTIAEDILRRQLGVKHCGPSATCFHCRMRNMLLTCCACDVLAQEGAPWRGALIKLHGSIAWHRCKNKSCIRYGCIMPDCACKTRDSVKCVRCQHTSRPMLFRPSALKKYSDEPGAFVMWEAASAALAEATQLVMFGFSFPESDNLIRGLFRNSVTGRLKKVFVIDLCPDRVLTALSACLPSELRPEIELLPTRSDYGTPNWYQAEEEGDAAHADERLPSSSGASVPATRS
jgi:hypothetical protein